MAYNETTVLGLVKARLNRLPTDTTLDDTLKTRIAGADKEFQKKGIILVETDEDDSLLLADYAVWRYQSRDKPGDIPVWLDKLVKARWLAQDRSAET